MSLFGNSPASAAIAAYSVLFGVLGESVTWNRRFASDVESPRGCKAREIMMKRNVLATLIAALLVIGLLGLATAQGGTAEQLIERLSADRHLIAVEMIQVYAQGSAA